MALCKACTKAFGVRIRWGKRPRGRPILHHGSVRSFVRSADGGCYVCSRVLSGLPGHLQARVRAQTAPPEAAEGGRGGGAARRGARRRGGIGGSIATRMDCSGPDGVGFTFGPGAPGLEDVSSGVYFTLIPLRAAGRPQQQQAGPTGARRVASRSTGSEETLAKIRGWLARCDAEHAGCCGRRRAQRRPGWYPTRLVDVGAAGAGAGAGAGDGDGPPAKCRIASARDIPPGRPYATLSHRWGEGGGGDAARLTLRNMDAWAAEVPTEVLPQTFRDALAVARRCGIPYVWIDSLCIVQEGDGNADWEREAPTMQDVYSHAAFNICASWGDDAGGLFAARAPADVEYPEIRIRRSRRRGLRFFGASPRATARGAFLVVDRDAWWAQVDDSPLSRRGWVFQERLLSLRNVHFCSRQVFFECGEHRGGEALGLGLSYHRTDREPKHDIYKQLLAGAPGPAQAARRRRTVAYLWEEVVSSYSACHLTYRADRLIAIAGVAQRFKPLLGDIYVAGLWLSRLPFEMLWRNQEEQLQATTTTTTTTTSSTHSHPDHHRRRRDAQTLTFSWSWICGGAVWNGGHDPERGRAEHILPEVACVRYRTQDAAVAASRGGDDDHGDEPPLGDVFFALPAGPAVEVRVTGTLRRMAFRRRGEHAYVVPLGGPPSSSSSYSSHPAEENNDDDDDDEIACRQCTINLDRALGEAEMARLGRERRSFYVPWYDAGPAAGAQSGRGESSLECLLLELVDEGMARFRRLGLLYDSCAWRPAAPATTRGMRDVFLAPQADEDRLPCWRYDRQAGRHTIYLV